MGGVKRDGLASGEANFLQIFARRIPSPPPFPNFWRNMWANVLTIGGRKEESFEFSDKGFIVGDIG